MKGRGVKIKAQQAGKAGERTRRKGCTNDHENAGRGREAHKQRQAIEGRG